jgi:saccharopepsin
MSLDGVWRNGYGSVMSISQDGEGRIQGSYQSTTGSTGTYYLLGWADPRPPRPSRGQSLSLSIFWRSIGQDPADPSWHWVSGLGGQLVEEGRDRRILLMHDMVATTAFPGQAEIGRHIDKLVFVPMPEARVVEVAPASGIIAAAPAEGLPCPLAGTWASEGGPAIRLVPRLLHPVFGFAEARLEVEGRSCALRGFIDPFAGEEGCSIQAISLSGLLDAERGETISLSGGLDIFDKAITLTVFRNLGTSPGLSYTQTKGDQYRLLRIR